MAAEKLILKIESPCSEQWEKMQNAERGKFCQNCKKHVIDFTNLSDIEVAKFFKQAKGEVCGRLKPEQLNREIAIEPYTSHWSTRWLMACSVFIGFTSVTSALPFSFPNWAPIVQVEHLPIKDEKVFHDQRISLKICVIDSLTREPIAFATVLIQELNLGGQTDTNGLVQFKIPKFYEKNEFIMRVLYTGYSPVSKKFSIDNINETKTYEIFMSGGIDLIPVGGVFFYYEKPSFWQRIKNTFRRKSRDY